MNRSLKYMLDTNTCIYAINHRPESVLHKLIDVGAGAVCLSSITAAELAFGAVKSSRADTRIKLEAFFVSLPALPWGEDVIWHYGQTRLALERAGQRIGERDLLIASHALAKNLILVTNNTREFERIEGLKLENWV
jgi:tRNA(fMet)-specific endonuclease VapC